MRHIAITIIFGAALVGCSENRHQTVSAKPDHKVQTQKLAVPPTSPEHKTMSVATAKRTTDKQVLRQTKSSVNTQTSARNDKVSSGQAAPVQKKALRAMTFNESQFSDDASDYPSTAEAQKLEREKYNN